MQHVTISDVARQLDSAAPGDLQAICITAKRIAFNRTANDQLLPLLSSDFETATVRVRGS